MKRSFSNEVEALRLGGGESFRGEGVLAVTKALLQSGVGLTQSTQTLSLPNKISVGTKP